MTAASSTIDCEACGEVGEEGDEVFLVCRSATCLCNLLFDANLAGHLRQAKASSLACCMANCSSLSLSSIASSRFCLCISIFSSGVPYAEINDSDSSAIAISSALSFAERTSILIRVFSMVTVVGGLDLVKKGGVKELGLRSAKKR